MDRRRDATINGQDARWPHRRDAGATKVGRLDGAVVRNSEGFRDPAAAPCFASAHARKVRLIPSDRVSCDHRP